MTEPLFGQRAQPSYQSMLARSMLEQQLQPTPIGSWQQALAKMVGLGAGLWGAQRQQEKDDAAVSEGNKLIAGLLSPDVPQSPDAIGPAQPTRAQKIQQLAASDNPYASRFAQSILANELTKERKPAEYTLAEGEKGYGAFNKQTGQITPVEGFTPPKKADATGMTHIAGGYVFNKATGKMEYNPELADEVMRVKKAGATNINNSMNPYAEGAASKKVNEAAAEDIIAAGRGYTEAADTYNQIKQMNEILGGMDTGKLTPMSLEVKRWANSFGLDIDKEGVGALQTAKALNAEAVLKRLNSMKGPATERERDYLVKEWPNISTSVEGRAKMEGVFKRLLDKQSVLADTSEKLQDMMASGQVKPGEARSIMRELETRLAKEFSIQ